nr:ATP-binding protein [Streptomyces sp. GC420]
MAEFTAYSGDPQCIGEARRFAREFLTRVRAVHGPSLSDRALTTTQLVVSELVTNACKYAPGPILLDLRADAATVTVAVWDTAPALPSVWAADPGRIGCHGLETVLAACRSFEARREPVGKRVTARIALADDSTGHAAMGFAHDPAGELAALGMPLL